MHKKDDKTEKTDFQGAVSLDAIFAATKGVSVKEDKNKVIPSIIEEEIKVEIKGEAPIKEIDKPADIISKPVPPTPPLVNTEETESYKTAKQLISLGLLSDFSIQTSDEDESGTAISDFKGMSEDNLAEILKIDKQEKANEISSKYLPKGDLKEHQLKVFEILSNGGDLSQIAETPEKALERPFEGFDMDDQKRQVDVRYTDLVHGKGLDHESAITVIEKEVKSGKIRGTAQTIFEQYRNAHTEYVDGILETQKKEKEFKDLNFKENKKTLTAKLKEAGLKESVYKKVVSEYSKKNSDGGYVLVDKLKDILSNPEENHEIIFHLTDKKLFNETFKIKASNEAQKTIIRLASGSGKEGNRKSMSGSSTGADTAPWLRAAQRHNDNINK